MGTSQAKRAPRNENWKKVTQSLGNKDSNVDELVNLTAATILPSLPYGQLTLTMYSGIKEGLHFVHSVKKEGLENTIKKEGLQIAEHFIASSISNSLWNIARSQISPAVANSTTGKIAEIAFKKTINEIILKGAEMVIPNE